jgi:undecaprenyl-diphosphatase
MMFSSQNVLWLQLSNLLRIQVYFRNPKKRPNSILCKKNWLWFWSNWKNAFNIFKKYDDRLAYIITAVIAYIVFVTGVKIFIELTEILQSEYLATFDSAISSCIMSYRSPFLTDYFVFVTNMFNTKGYIIIFAVCTTLFYMIFKNWKYVVQLVLVMVLALSSNLILKQIINRTKPDTEHLVSVETLIYPSGHAKIANAFYGLLFYFTTQFAMRKAWKFYWSSFYRYWS